MSEFSLQLNIDDNGSTKVIVVPYRSLDETAHVRVLAEGFDATSEGALAVASLLRDVADGIESRMSEQLDASERSRAPSAPRFNPKPRGARAESKNGF